MDVQGKGHVRHTAGINHSMSGSVDNSKSILVPSPLTSPSLSLSNTCFFHCRTADCNLSTSHHLQGNQCRRPPSDTFTACMPTKKRYSPISIYRPNANCIIVPFYTQKSCRAQKTFSHLFFSFLFMIK